LKIKESMLVRRGRHHTPGAKENQKQEMWGRKCGDGASLKECQ